MSHTKLPNAPRIAQIMKTFRTNNMITVTAAAMLTRKMRSADTVVHLHGALVHVSVD